MLTFRYAGIISFHINFLDLSHQVVALPSLLLPNASSLLYQLNVSLEKVDSLAVFHFQSHLIPPQLPTWYLLLQLPFSGDWGG